MRLKNSFLFIVFLAAIATGCRKDKDTNVQPIDITIKVSYEEEFKSYGFTLENINITLTNTTNQAVLTGKTDKNGIAVFSQVGSGAYLVSGTIGIEKNTFENLTGIELTGETATFNASTSSTLNPSTSNNLELSLAMARIGDWVIKQLYYAGSHTSNAAMFRDQFIEIYNNSNDVLYADSLYFGQLMGNNSKFETVDMSLPYIINQSGGALHKQFNWGMGIGVTPADITASENYVYMKSLFRVPGNGKQYPVAPGESFIIAATAQNHKAPFTDSEGEIISVKDPSLTIDLSQADFEVYLGKVIPNPLTSDVDNTGVPNVAVVQNGDRDLVFDPTGRDAVVIFKTDKALPLQGQAGEKGFGHFPAPTAKVIDQTTSLYYQIPNELIIDAIQVINPNPNATQRVARKLVNSLDAGPTNVPGAQYSSQSLIRKTKKVIGGRRVLMDTNNSAADFDFFPLAQPGGFKD